MTPEQYQRVKDLFYRWCEAPPDVRARLVEELAGEEAFVRAEVLAKIELDADTGAASSFLAEPALGRGVIDSALDTSDRRRAAPEKIGHYRIVREIGMGGMGVVYEAEQDSPRRTVALKVIRPGVAGSRTLRRFEFEADVLGRLQHPGIAQIFEAGTFDDGLGPQPYFAMELIRGKPLLEHADAHDLDTIQRLRLVSRVADAVQHAHQHGIVHRDLKPDNILVQDDGESKSSAGPRSGTATGTATATGGGQPKVLDFGVARLTDADVNATTVGTDIGQIVGTLAYMSPEQAGGHRDEVDHRSDVYALGVIAYELLAGARPYDLGGLGLAEAVRVIEEREPDRLGSIDRALRGDVETIVAKSLDRDKNNRYASAAEFAADIERHLADQPILARPPSTVYQFRKFARRNRAVFTGTLVAMIALLVGLAVTSVALVGALRSADRARHEQAIAAEVSAFLQTTLASVDPTAPSEARNLRQLLDGAARRAWDELDSAEVAQPVHLTIGRAYLTLAAFDEAERHLSQAHEFAREAFGPNTAEEAEVLVSLGDMRRATSEYKDAETLYKQALRIRREVAPGAPVADSLRALGNAQISMGDYTEAEASYRAALALHEETLGPGHASVAEDLHELGVLLIDTQKLEEAERHVTRALEVRRALFGDEHPTVAYSLKSLGWLNRRAERHEEAERYYRQSLAILRAVLDPDHPTIALVLERIAASLESLGRGNEADPLYEEALDMQRATLGPRHRDIGTTLNNIAGVRRRRGDYAGASRLYAEALSIYREQLGRDHVWTAIVLENLARNYELAGEFAEAEPYVEDCVRIREAYFSARDEGRWPIAMIQTLHALCLADRDEFAEAEPMLVDALATLREERGDAGRETRLGAERAAQFYRWWDRAEEAARWSAFANPDAPPAEGS